MKKLTYEEAIIELFFFKTEDVVTLSGEDEGNVESGEFEEIFQGMEI